MKKSITLFLVLCLTFGACIMPFSVYAEPYEGDRSLPDGYETVIEFEEEEPSSSSSNLQESSITLPERVISSHTSTTSLSTNSVASSNGSPIPNGVYAFQNLGNDGLWMDIQYDSTSPGYHVQQYQYSSSPSEWSTAPGLYRVTKHPLYDTYIIRLMLNESLTFGFSGSEVLTKTISLNDSSVAQSDTFSIYYSAGGFFIIPYGSSYCIAANNTDASGMSGAPLSYLTKRTAQAAGDQAKWIPEGYASDFPEGVYAIANRSCPYMYMDVEQDTPLAGFHMQKYNYDDPTVDFNRGGLYKISHSQYGGHYVIRSMLNNTVSFSIQEYESGSQAFMTSTVSEYDNAVPLANTYSLQYVNGAYCIKPGGSSMCVTVQDTWSSGSADAPDSYLVPELYSSGGVRSQWFLIPYTGEHCSGANLYAPQSFEAGEENYISATTWSTVQDVNDCYITLSDYDTSVVTYDGNTSMSHSITVFPHDAGTFVANIVLWNGSSAYTTYSHTFTVTIPFEDGTYFIQNAAMETFLGANAWFLELTYLYGDDVQKFEITHQGNGYYTIYSAYYERELECAPGGSDWTTLWTFIPSSNGTYLIYPYKDPGLLVEHLTVASDGEVVVDEVVLSDMSRWYMWKLADATLAGIPDTANPTSHAHSSSFNLVAKKLKDIGYSSQRRVTEMTKQDAIMYIATSKIFVIRTHGAQNAVVIDDPTGQSQDKVRLTTNDLAGLNSNFFGNCSLVLYGACETGKGESAENNMVNATLSKGAQSVIGFTDTINCEETNGFTKYLFVALWNNKTVSEAVDFAKEAVMYEYGTDFDDEGECIATTATIQNKVHWDGNGNLLL